MQGEERGAAAEAARSRCWDERRALRLVRDDKVVRGRDGWLFLAGDANEVLAQHAGKLPFDATTLERWHDTLERRVAFLDGLGVPYYFLVAPDTHAVYADKLPDGFEPAAERPIDQLRRHLAARRSRISLIYPLDELLAARRKQPVCTPVDSHWTEYGAFVAYTRLIDEMDSALPVRRITEDEIAVQETEIHGDLGFKVGRTGPTATVAFPRAARLVRDNLVENTGAYLVTECRDAPAVKCLFVTDSYGIDLAPFMRESFRRLVFVQTPTLDREVVESERPDVVVSLMAERFMIVVPDDRGALSFAERERSKVESGRLRPRFGLWDVEEPSPEPAPPAEVERIRAGLLGQGRLQEATLVSVLAYAGLRGREALALTWLAIGNDSIEIAPVGYRDTDTTRKELGSGGARTVRLLPSLAEDLERWREACDAPRKGPVFRNENGSRWSVDQWRTWVRAMYGATGTNPLHLRRTFGALLLREGVEWPAVAREMGELPQELPHHYASCASTDSDSVLQTADEQVQLARTSST